VDDNGEWMRLETHFRTDSCMVRFTEAGLAKARALVADI
jgi:hypothetical protein